MRFLISVLLVCVAIDAGNAAGPGISSLHLRGGSDPFVPSNAKHSYTVPDGRMVSIVDDDKAIPAAIVEGVQTIGSAAIQSKGAFSLAIPGGSVVKALSGLKPDSLDFSKVHVFFCNERIGEYKCYKTAVDSLSGCGIPKEQIHKVGEGEPADVAAAYEKLLADQPSSLVGKTENGIPKFDLVLLGTGEDGHVGSLHPGSDEVKASGQGKIALPIDKGGKKSIALSMDVMCAADNVLLSAGSSKRADMVKTALQGSFEPFSSPAALVRAKCTTWICDKAAVVGADVGRWG